MCDNSCKENVFPKCLYIFAEIKQLYILQTVSFFFICKGKWNNCEVISGSLCSGISQCGSTSVHAVTECSSKD